MMQDKRAFRYEADSMGQVPIPSWAYWGAQTQRALENFPSSGHRLPMSMVHAMALIKKHAATSNAQLGLLEPRLAEVIARASTEILEGSFDEHFPLDVFQTGSATSSNMNVNEVIANRANELLGFELGTRNPVHPNDHVNMGQSSNDVVPSALQIACRLGLDRLDKALTHLAKAIRSRASALSHVIKLGRTHLQDAVPMTLGQELGAWACQVEKSQARLQACTMDLQELALGGTAIGTGLNCHPEFGRLATLGIAKETGIAFVPGRDRFELIAARDAQVNFMGSLNALATVFMKLGNDIRLLASGPRGSLGELILPTLQPGSSIMPGKVNPVIPEMLIQVAAHVNGKAVSVTIAGQNSPLQLNMMHPLIAFEIDQSIKLLANAAVSLADQVFAGLTADEERCRWWVDWSLALVTPLNKVLGYDKAAALAYKAFNERKKIFDVVVDDGVMTREEALRLLDPATMLGS